MVRTWKLWDAEVTLNAFPLIADDALGDEEDEEEGEAIVNQVLDELGLQLTDELAGVAGVPSGTSVSAADKNKKTAVAAGGEEGGGATDADADLQARLDDLRRE